MKSSPLQPRMICSLPYFNDDRKKHERRTRMLMHGQNKRLFVGVKISPKLQKELDNCTGGAERYFKEDKPESLRIVSFGENKIIGRFLCDGFPVTDIGQVSLYVRSMVTLITSGHRIEDDSVRIFIDSSAPNQ